MLRLMRDEIARGKKGQPGCRRSARAARDHRAGRRTHSCDPRRLRALGPGSCPHAPGRGTRRPGPRAVPGRRAAARDATGRVVVADGPLHRRGRAPHDRSGPRVAGDPELVRAGTRRPASLVLACGPTDLHTIGLEALCVLLRYDGWSCRLLGARTSVPALAAAMHATGADAVVIVSHLTAGAHEPSSRCGQLTVRGRRCSTQATPSPHRAADATCLERISARACRTRASSSPPSWPEHPAFDIGQATEDAVVQPGLECPGETGFPDLAAPTDLFGDLHLGHRRSGLADREEQVGVLVQARGSITPVHLKPLLRRIRGAAGRPHCSGPTQTVTRGASGQTPRCPMRAGLLNGRADGTQT